MNDPSDSGHGDPMTLDPPGSIAIVGAGPLGVEAALYGRFLGYNVTVIEAVSVGHWMTHLQDQPIPILPDRCLSPLAVSALAAQHHDDQSTGVETHLRGKTLPTTYRQWIHDGLVALTETDLLRGRLRTPSRVTRIDTIAVGGDDESEDTSEIPPDFRLTLNDPNGQSDSIESEAVIVATGAADDIEFGCPQSQAYLYRIGKAPAGDLEQDLIRGLREIVAIYAELAGRSDLDLYRPRRV